MPPAVLHYLIKISGYIRIIGDRCRNGDVIANAFVLPVLVLKLISYVGEVNPQNLPDSMLFLKLETRSQKVSCKQCKAHHNEQT